MRASESEREIQRGTCPREHPLLFTHNESEGSVRTIAEGESNSSSTSAARPSLASVVDGARGAVDKDEDQRRREDVGARRRRTCDDGADDAGADGIDEEEDAGSAKGAARGRCGRRQRAATNIIDLLSEQCVVVFMTIPLALSVLWS